MYGLSFLLLQKCLQWSQYLLSYCDSNISDTELQIKELSKLGREMYTVHCILVHNKDRNANFHRIPVDLMDLGQMCRYFFIYQMNLL